MAITVGDSSNSYARETFVKPPPKKKWIQEYLEKAPPSPQVEPPQMDHVKLKSLKELKEDFCKDSKNAMPFTEEEVLAKLLDPIRNGDKFNKSLKRLSWNPEPLEDTMESVTPPDVEDVLEFMEETNVSQNEVRGVVKGVISQFLNASLSDSYSEFRRSRKRSHKHHNSRDSHRDQGGYRHIRKHERSLSLNPPLAKIQKSSLAHPQINPTIPTDDANGVLNLSLPKKGHKVHFSEMDNCYSTESGVESYQISKSKTLSNLEILANVSSGHQQSQNFPPAEINTTSIEKICMDNVEPKQLLITSPVFKTEVMTYSVPGNAAVLSMPDLVPMKTTTLSSGIGAPLSPTKMGAFLPVSVMSAPPPIVRMGAVPVSVISSPLSGTRISAHLPISVMTASLSKMGSSAPVSSVGTPVSVLGAPPPLMMVTTISAPSPSLPIEPYIQVEPLPLIKKSSSPPLIPRTIVLTPTTERYSPKENIPIRCGPMPTTQGPPNHTVDLPMSFKKGAIMPNPQATLIKPAIPFLTVIQPVIPPTSSIKTSQKSSFITEKADTLAEEPRRTSSCSREVHNRLEKNRRAHLKKCFDDLATEVELDPKKASNLTVIRSAFKYVQVLRRKERENENDLANLVQAKISLQNRLQHLKREFPGYKAESDCE